MKIGIILIGHLRNYYQNNYNFLKLYLLNYFKKLKITFEFFIHTWDVISLENLTPVDLKTLQEIYQTENIIIEKQEKTMIKNISFNHPSIPYQWYALHQILEKFGDKLNVCDYIIKIRPDVLLRRNINLIFDNKIHFYQSNLCGGCDVLFYGKREILINGIKLYEENEIIKDIKKESLKKPELVYQEYWKKKNILFEKENLKFLKVINILR
jgi:hypothetical protein